MAVGFGFCPNCGAPLNKAEQKFCAVCGTVLAVRTSPPPEAATPNPQASYAPPLPPVQPTAQPPVQPTASQPPVQQPLAPMPPQWLQAPGAPAPGLQAPGTQAPGAQAPGGQLPPPWATSAAAPSGPQGAPPQMPPQWAMPAPAALPPARRKTPINPLIAGIGAIAVVAVVVGAVYATSNRGPSASGNPARSGSPTVTPGASASPAPASATAAPPNPLRGARGSKVTPARFPCDGTDPAPMPLALPAGVKEDVQVTMSMDGNAGDTVAVSDQFDAQADGSWLASDDETMSTLCEELGTGKHSITLADSTGKTLAQGSFTITGAAASPTPGVVSGGAILVTPALFSCSGSTTQVRLTIVLGPSVSADEDVDLMIDDKLLGSDTVGSGFEKQADGSWLASDYVEIQNLCAYGDGPHTASIWDSSKRVLASGVFTTEP